MHVRNWSVMVSDTKHSPVGNKAPEGFIGDGFGDGVELLGICINSKSTPLFGTYGKCVHQQPVYYMEPPVPLYALGTQLNLTGSLTYKVDLHSLFGDITVEVVD